MKLPGSVLRSRPRNRDERIRFVGISALLLVYFFTTRAGLRVNTSSHEALLIWPSSGIALATLLIFGQKCGPGLLVTAFCAHWASGLPALTAFGVGVGNTIGAVVAADLLRRFGFQRSLERTKDVMGLILIAGIASTLISATVASLSLFWSGSVSSTAFYTSWLTLWFGDMAGNLAIAPFFLVSSTGFEFRMPRWKTAESVVLMILVFVAAILIFPDWIAPDSRFLRPALVFPILIPVAVRLGQKGGATSMFVITIFAIGATASGHGKFWSGSLVESILQTQIFLSIVAITEMVLASATIERRRERDALSASNAQREAILNSSLDPIVTIDHHGSFVEFNPAAEKIFGYKRDNVLGKEMASLIIPPRLRDAHRSGMARYLVTGEGPVLGKRIELPAVRSDGTEFPTELSIVPLGTSAPMFTGFIQDITEKKQIEAEKRRRDEAERFLLKATKAIFESIDYKSTLAQVVRAPVGDFADWSVVQIVNPETGVRSHFEWASSAHENLAQLQSHVDRFTGDFAKCALLPSTFDFRKAHLVADASEDFYREIGADEELLRQLRTIAPKSILAVPLLLRGQSIGVISIGSLHRHYDSSDLEVLEEMARRAANAIENSRLYQQSQEAIYARDEFLSIASHELKTPLTSLSLQLQILRRRCEKPDIKDAAKFLAQAAKDIVRMETQCKRLANLLEELLDLTRMRLGRLQLEPEKIDLAAMVRDAVEQFSAEAAQKGVTIFENVPEPVLGTWDKIRMEQVVGNLLSNAIKYGEGKPISVSVATEPFRRMARLTVKDQGMGISAESQDLIFKRFERAVASGKKIEGLGLGLYITQQIVEAHGGSIRVESTVGQGSTFTVEIPLETARSPYFLSERLEKT